MSKDKNKDKDVQRSSSGLKRRNYTAETPVRVIRKPNKMNLVKPRKASGEVDYSVATMLQLPTDKLGLTRGLRKEMLRLAARIGSDQRNLDLLNETLGTLMKHVEARYADNVERGTRVLKRRSDRLEEVEGQSEELELPSYQDMLKALQTAEIELADRKKSTVEEAYLELIKEVE